jgi:REP element-mobilizing transposase RayT
MPWEAVYKTKRALKGRQDNEAMPQSLAKLYTHLVLSTKHREPRLADDIRADLHAYVGGTLPGLGCHPIEINSEPEHIHALFLLGRTIPLSDAIGQLKTSSNDWLRTQDVRLAQFYWQGGYGAFSAGQPAAPGSRPGGSGVDELRQYIRNQREHHRQVSYQDEFRTFLRRYEIHYDERYVWD